MKPVFAYIRVSTQKQGVHGSSLGEQRAAIVAYAARHGLSVIEWFEERETAAKRGRTTFARMMRGLLRKEASGVVIHKVDRSARNFRDWADVVDLLDQGIEVHFAHESLDMHSRGGRLAADVQAIVAADFIRNLREEVKKGLDGRLKQGIYPFQAPIGYRDMGGGKHKMIDAVQGPLVRQAFELYATGEFNFQQLQQEMHRRGLRSKTGKAIRFATLTRMLNNPFYYGLIHIKKSNALFDGGHVPLVRKALFDRVQSVLRGNRLAGASWTHDFPFRRVIRCAHCGRTLIGEIQKKRYVYYRCHDPKCPPVCLSEKAVDSYVSRIFELIRIEGPELRDLRDIATDMRSKAAEEADQRKAALQLQMARCVERLSRLSDAYIDGVLDKEAVEAKRREILDERRTLEDEIAHSHLGQSRGDSILQALELANTAYLQYQNGLSEEKRHLLSEVTSNFVGDGKEPAISLKTPFQGIAEYALEQQCAHLRDDRRTRVKKLWKMLEQAGEVEEARAKAANDNASKSEVGGWPRYKVPEVLKSLDLGPGFGRLRGHGRA